MLVLSRKVGESVVIGNDIIVTVIEVRGDMVRIGVQAPREVAVHREEVFAELAKTNAAAVLPAGRDLTGLVPPGRPAGGKQP